MYIVDKNSAFTNPNGAINYYSPMPFRSLAKIVNCPCEDGKRRTIRITGEPDTFFSVPASVCVKKTRVSGFVSLGENGPKFIAYKYRKNAKLIPIVKD